MSQEYFKLLAKARRLQAECHRVEAQADRIDPYGTPGLRAAQFEGHARAYDEMAARYEAAAAPGDGE